MPDRIKSGQTTRSGYSSGSTSSAIQAYTKAADEARKANELRYQQMMQIYDQVISQYQPGGQFGQGALALYEQGKSKAMSSGMQSLVNSGLSNTTVSAGLPIQYEQEVGAPFRLQLEDMRMSRLAEAQAQKAGAIERRQDVAPDPGLLAQLATQASATTQRSSTGISNINAAHEDFMNRLRGTSYSGSSSTRTTTPDTMMPGGAAAKASQWLQSTSGGSSGTSKSSLAETDYQSILQQNLKANPTLPGASSIFTKPAITPTSINLYPSSFGDYAKQGKFL